MVVHARGYLYSRKPNNKETGRSACSGLGGRGIVEEHATATGSRFSRARRCRRMSGGRLPVHGECACEITISGPDARAPGPDIAKHRPAQKAGMRRGH